MLRIIQQHDRRRERVERNRIFQMTGLEVETCHILEIACFITDEHLELASDDLNIVVHQSDEVLENMSDWCKLQHRKVNVSFFLECILYSSGMIINYY